MIVRRGSSFVKIYRETKGAGACFRVSFYMGGKRCGRNFADLEAAKAEAEAKAAQLSRGDLNALHITGRDRLVYGRALDALGPLSIPLDAAAIEFAEAKKLLGAFSLADAARFYMRHHGHGIHAKAVADAVAEMIAAKAEKGVSTAYLADLRYRLGVFAAAFQCNVNSITADDVREFLSRLSLAPRGYNNTVACLKTFFRFAQNRACLSKEADLLTSIETPGEGCAHQNLHPL